MRTQLVFIKPNYPPRVIVIPNESELLGPGQILSLDGDKYFVTTDGTMSVIDHPEDPCIQRSYILYIRE
jgi:hypothetical protein